MSANTAIHSFMCASRSCANLKVEKWKNITSTSAITAEQNIMHRLEWARISQGRKWGTTSFAWFVLSCPWWRKCITVVCKTSRVVTNFATMRSYEAFGRPRVLFLAIRPQTGWRTKRMLVQVMYILACVENCARMIQDAVLARRHTLLLFVPACQGRCQRKIALTGHMIWALQCSLSSSGSACTLQNFPHLHEKDP